MNTTPIYDQIPSKNDSILIGMTMMILFAIVTCSTLVMHKMDEALDHNAVYGAPRALYIGEAKGARMDPYTLGKIAGLCMGDAIYVVAYNETTSDTVWCDQSRIANGLAPYAPYTEEKSKAAKKLAGIL